MKKFASQILGVLLACSLLAGCQPGSSQQQSATPEKSLRIGLSQIQDHPSLNTIRESFLEELKSLGYGHVQVDYKNAQGDMSNLGTISQTFVGDEVDLIVAIATPSAISAASATQDIPVLFSAITDPTVLVENPAAPEGNVTGVSDAIPVDSIFEMAAQLTPDAKTFGFVYNLSEDNSLAVIKQAKAYCDQNGLQYLEATATNTAEVQQAALSLVGKVDAYFAPIDNTVATAMGTFAQVAIDAKLPIYPSADSMVIDGGLATVGIDYTQLGQKTAQMAVNILQGTPISELPVVTMENFRPIINQNTADALGIEIEGLQGVEIVSDQQSK